VRVIAAGSHDTASAVAGTPFETGDDAAYLSCGTWSLLGVELDRPCVTDDSREMNFTNEGGLEGKIRFLKNINGLWMMQQLLKHHNQKLSENERLGFPELIANARKAERTDMRVPPNDPSFTNPPDMAEAVRAYCEKTGQHIPRGVGETAMAIYNGLTDEYVNVLRDLEEIRQQPIHTLHIVGGGVRDTFLCQLTANATGKRVVAGPVEASALGNVTAQLIGLGAVADLKEGRRIIRESFEPAVYTA
jgi:rhamnulokinase